MIPNHYQLAIYDAIRNTDASIQVEACPGSGKTTTSVESMSIPPPGRKLAVAYNRAIRNTLAERVPLGVEPYTFHQIGFKLLRRAFPSLDLNTASGANSKNGLLVRQAFPSKFKDDYAAIWRILSYGKDLGVGFHITNTPDSWEKIIDAYDSDLDDELIGPITRLLPDVLERSNLNTAQIDFSDMILLPLVYNLTPWHYRYIWVDEAQDMSLLFHHWIDVMRDVGARIFVFGDTKQSIYAFRGADSEAMNHFHAMFDTQLMPLSITYRCSRAVVSHAQHIYPDIEAAPDAPDGFVQYLSDYPQGATYGHTDLILCRNNAPLISLAMRFLSEGIRFNILGNFLTNLIGFVKKFKTTDITIFRSRLTQWASLQTQKALAKKNNSKIAAIADRCDTLTSLAEGTADVSALISNIRHIAAAKTGVRLSTIHRAKGLEAERVFILRPDLMPSSFATREWEQVQERNLEFVACTRAKAELYFLPEA